MKKCERMRERLSFLPTLKLGMGWRKAGGVMYRRFAPATLGSAPEEETSGRTIDRVNSNCNINMRKGKKVKWSLYKPVVAQRLGRSIALLFYDRGSRRGWVVSSTPRPNFTPGKDPVPIVQEAVWAPGPVWAGGQSRPHRDSIPDRPARSQ